MAIQNQYYFKSILILFIVVSLSGCASINYYSQSIQGQIEVLHKRQDINDILKENDIPDSLRNKLNTVLLLRDFSIKQLGLPENDSYLSYADIERDYVIWNIFANEEFSLKPVSWCYLIVGCLSYRGYFSKADAKEHARELAKQGYDIYLGGVSAYSTLGWFNDPMLNTMLRWSDIRIATVMFHELAHQQLYIKNDTQFNESYADTVAHIGVTKWLEHSHKKIIVEEYQQYLLQENAFVTLVMRYKLILNDIYHSPDNQTIKRKNKKQALQNMKKEYYELTKIWKKNPYETWFSTELNNAKLAAIVTYREYVSKFLTIYEKLGNDLAKFYSYSKSLSKCKPMKRKEILNKQEIEFEC